MTHVSFPEGEALKSLFVQFDEVCFPEEMHLDDEELLEFFGRNLIGILLTENDELVALGILMKEEEVAEELEDFDPLFIASEDGYYSYSVAVKPEFEGKGYASTMLQLIRQTATERGGKQLTAHVRTSNGWHKKRANLLNPDVRRTVPNAWEIDGDVEFQLLRL